VGLRVVEVAVLAQVVWEHAEGADANDVGLVLAELARVRVAQKRLDDADRLLARSRAIVSKAPEDDEGRLGMELGSAELLLARGRSGEAAAILEAALPHAVADLRAQIVRALDRAKGAVTTAAR
jgi:hypothetical protein